MLKHQLVCRTYAQPTILCISIGKQMKACQEWQKHNKMVRCGVYNKQKCNAVTLPVVTKNIMRKIHHIVMKTYTEICKYGNDVLW